jgi:hypothetical protein
VARTAGGKVKRGMGREVAHSFQDVPQNDIHDEIKSKLNSENAC